MELRITHSEQTVVIVSNISEFLVECFAFRISTHPYKLFGEIAIILFLQFSLVIK